MVKELQKHPKVIVDENGTRHEVTNVGGLIVGSKCFEIPQILLSNTKAISFRDDDILLVTQPKTGTV